MPSPSSSQTSRTWRRCSCTSSQVWCTVSSGAPGQLELAARLEGDRTLRVVGERDHVVALDHRLPAEARHALQQGADAVRPVIGHAAQIGRGGRRISRARCRSARTRAASIPDSRYSTSCRQSVIGSPGVLGVVVIRGGTPWQNGARGSAALVDDARPPARSPAAGAAGAATNRRRSPGAPPGPPAQPCRRAGPWARARRG